MEKPIGVPAIVKFRRLEAVHKPIGVSPGYCLNFAAFKQFASHRLSRCIRSIAHLSSFASMVILVFNRREMGQFDFAAFAAASNFAESAPEIFARTSR